MFHTPIATDSNTRLPPCRLECSLKFSTQGRGEGLLGLARTRAGRFWKLRAVDRRHGLDLARGRGEECLFGGTQVGHGPGALLDVERLDQAIAGDRLEHPVVERRRAQTALWRDPEDR